MFPTHAGIPLRSPGAWILLGLLATFGCRTPRRAVSTEGQPVKVKVALTGLTEDDRNRPEWIYELAGCTKPINGNLKDPGEVEFSMLGAKRGLSGCEVRVKILNPGPSYTFAGPDTGVLYQALDVEISQDADGALIAEAELQRLYSVIVSSDTKFVLRVPLTFPNAEGGKIITGLLDQCQPNFSASSVFERTSDKEGTLILTASIPTTQTTSCKTLWVDVDGIARKYIATNPDAVKFTAKPAASADLSPLTVKATPKGSGSIKVEAKPANKPCDVEKEVFDTASRTCKPKP